MKKFLAMLLALLLLCSLCACGAKTEAEEAADEVEGALELPGEDILEEELPESDCPHEKLTAKTTAATCTKDGSIVYICDACGVAVKTETLKATGHTYKYESDADNHWQVCTVCGEKGSTATHTMKNGVCTVCGYGCTHTMQSKVIAPTATESGYTLHTCSKCGYSYKDTFVSPTGTTESASEGETDTTPTLPEELKTENELPEIEL